MVHNREQPEAWSREAVATALRERDELSPEEARRRAHRLAKVFDGKGTIEDDEVEKDERAFLWSMLLDGLVTVETETRPHPDHGRPWRYFFWHLVSPDRLADRTEEEPEEPTVYDELPSGAWKRETSAA